MNLLLRERFSPYLLLGLYLLIAASLALRIKVEATHYTSPDSHFYLRVAENLKAGKGLKALKCNVYPFQENAEEFYFALWPAGYPVLILGTSLLTNTSTLVASKLVNLLFLGLIFMLLYRWLGRYAWFAALYFCSYSMLEVYSYTWTEGPFLFFVLLLCFFIYQDQKQQTPNPLLFLQLFSCLTALFLLRYAGVCYFFFALIFLIKHLQKKDYNRSLHYFAALGLASVVVVVYLWINKENTGYLTGAYRIKPDADSLGEFITMLYQGLLNEITIIRNYYFTNYTDLLYIATVLLQACLLLVLYKKYNGIGRLSFPPYARELLLAGVVYLVFVIIIRKLQPFDPFNYRILAPFSAPVYIALLGALTQQADPIYFRKTYPYIAAFFCFPYS